MLLYKQLICKKISPLDPQFTVKLIQGVDNPTYCWWMNFARVFGLGTNNKGVVDGAYATNTKGHANTKDSPHVSCNFLIGEQEVPTRTFAEFVNAC